MKNLRIFNDFNPLFLYLILRHTGSQEASYCFLDGGKSNFSHIPIFHSSSRETREKKKRTWGWTFVCKVCRTYFSLFSHVLTTFPLFFLSFPCTLASGKLSVNAPTIPLSLLAPQGVDFSPASYQCMWF